ncbi:MAG TPA: helix-turn-helix transcriptional regulator, partial [Candidatus Scatomorpha merdavium]|nr:helix-turn-helix transcriptional regulator [Candidatus Scatomorpha merdavium]
MEDKRSLGEYIAEHRRALGLTQRQFAERLYVTDSAVSKWERGLSYPDITLLHDICAVLGVTEHELLTASEDTEARRAGALARRYL